MKEQELLHAIGRVSDETVNKTALPDTANLDSDAHPEKVTAKAKKPIKQTKKRSVNVHAGAAAAVVALCIALNAAIFYGVAKLRSADDSGIAPGMQLSDEVQDMDQPYVEVLDSASNSVTVVLHNLSEDDLNRWHPINYPVFEIRQNGEFVAICEYAVGDEEAEELTYTYHFSALPNGTYELVNRVPDSNGEETEPIFETVTFEIDAEENGKVFIEDYTGQDFEKAKHEILANGMYVDKRSAFDPEVPEGCIISMDAGEQGGFSSEGMWLLQGDYVRITVSLGKNHETIPVPDYIGEQFDEILTEAQELGISVVKKTVHSAEPEGTILKMTDNLDNELEAGTEIDRDSLVVMQVSTGIAKVIMPNLVGWDVDTAQITAEGLDLHVIVEEADDSAPAGKVIAQSIEPNTEVQSKDTLVLTVSSGQG